MVKKYKETVIEGRDPHGNITRCLASMEESEDGLYVKYADYLNKEAQYDGMLAFATFLVLSLAIVVTTLIVTFI